jgi:hypothetical protein
VPKAAEYNMASDNPRSHNNSDFQLNEIFGVKGKVALITGTLELTHTNSSATDPVQAEGQASA